MISLLVISAVIYTFLQTYHSTGVMEDFKAKLQRGRRPLRLKIPAGGGGFDNSSSTNNSFHPFQTGIQCYVCESYSNFDDQNITISYGDGGMDSLNLTIGSGCRQPIDSTTTLTADDGGKNVNRSNLIVKELHCPRFSACASIRYVHLTRGDSFQRICYNSGHKKIVGCRNLGDVVPQLAMPAGTTDFGSENKNRTGIGRTSVKINRLVSIPGPVQSSGRSYGRRLPDGTTSKTATATNATNEPPLFNITTADTDTATSPLNTSEEITAGSGVEKKTGEIGTNAVNSLVQLITTVKDIFNGNQVNLKSKPGQLWKNVNICICKTNLCNTYGHGSN